MGFEIWDGENQNLGYVIGKLKGIQWYVEVPKHLWYVGFQISDLMKFPL